MLHISHAEIRKLLSHVRKAEIYYCCILSPYRGSFNGSTGLYEAPAPAEGPRLVCPPAVSGRLTGVWSARGLYQ